MSEVNLDHQAYEFLCEAVTKSKTLQLAHYGSSLEELQAAVARINEGSAEPYPTTASPFARDPHPVSYYYPFEKIRVGRVLQTNHLGRVRAKADEIIMVYSVNDSSHGLTGFTLSHKLPQVTAMPGFRVRWAHNVGSHIVRYGVFVHQQTQLFSFDSITSDMHIASFSSGEDASGIEIDLGNKPELQTFSEFLPQSNTVFSPCFPFSSADPTNMFPLYKCAHSDEITVAFIFKSDPQSLLIVAKEVVDADGNISLELVTPAEGVRYATFKEDGKATDTFSNPVAVSHHVFQSQDECQGNWCASKLEDSKSEEANSFYVNQAFAFTTKNPAKSSLLSIDKINVPYPVTSISWVAQQTQCEANHIYSNYTTNPGPNFLDSVSGIKATSISNGRVTLLDAAPSILTSGITPLFSTRKRHAIPGINVRSFGIRTGDPTIKPGFLFNNGGMDFNVEETDPQVLNGNRPESGDNYTVEARLFGRVKFMFASQCHSDKERVSGGKTNIVVV